MEWNELYRPRPTSVCLVFASEHGGHVADLRQGIRRYLTRFYHMETALRISTILTYDYQFSRDRKRRCILIRTEEEVPTAVLVDLYARLALAGGYLRTPSTTYVVTIEGNVDTQQVQALTWHYFWTNSLFERHIVRKTDRHLFN